MGCFNTTCFLTGQTIAPGDRAYIFPIQQSIGYKQIEFAENPLGIKSVVQPYDSTCYANAFWQPMGGMISCAYDDYGRFEVDRTKMNEGNITKFLNHDFLTTLVGENRCHDLAFDPNKMDLTDPIKALEEVWDVMVHEGRVFTYRSYNRLPTKVGFAVVCAPAFDLAVAEYGKFKDWDKNKLDVDSQMERLMKVINDAWDANSGIEEKITKILADESTKEIFKEVDGEPVSDEEMREAIRELASYKATDTVRSMFDGGEAYRFNHYMEISHIIKTGRPEGERAVNVMAFLRMCIMEKSFFSYLEVLNAKVQPIIYASQDYDNEIGRTFAKFVNAVQKKVTAGRKDEEAED